MSVQDAFRNMLGRIADHFLDTAARLAAAQLQKGFLGLFTNLFSFGEIGDTGLTSGDRMLGSRSMGRRANGGVVNAGKSYIVGERGAEMFVPNAGGRIVPNSDLGGMGSTNIVVNVDASGSNVEGDEDEGRALGIALSAAIETELIKQKRPGGLLA
jgi:phage-related minor tail protein